MKNIIAFVFCLLFQLHFIHAQGTGYVYLEGKQFIDHTGAPFYPILLNWGSLLQYDGANNCYPSPYHSFGPTNTFECQNQTECNTQILNQFKYIRSLGFNGIRLNGPSPYYNHILNQFQFDTYDQNVNNKTTLDFATNANILLDAYLNILNIAANVPGPPFYVIINTGGAYNKDGEGKILYDWSLAQPYYLSFLEELGDKIKNHSRLLAYDLYNEPCYAIKKDPLFSKNESCVLVQEWVDAIKINDQNHLTTIGNCWDESIQFDPACLKIDFNSPHFYPYSGIYGQSIQTTPDDYQNHVKGILYWLGKNMPIPWIVGETGFTAIDGHPSNPTWQNYLNGTEASQELYAQTTVPITRDCEASGFSWWNYQDYFDKSDTDAKRGLNFFGILKRDINTCPDPLDPCAAMNKPVTSFFSTYGNNPLPPVNSSNCLPPPSSPGLPDYLDPYNHNTMNSSGAGEVTGTVTDQDGNPVGDALVNGWGWLNTTLDLNGNNVYNLNHFYTFTRSIITADPSNLIGTFKLRPFNYLDPNTTASQILTHIWFAGIGLENKHFGAWDHNQLPQINYNPSLNRIHFGYQGLATNLTISATQHNLRGGQELTVSNSIINNFSYSEISARKKIFLSEFRAELGSYVHIFNSDYDHCISYDGLRIVHPFTSDINANNYNFFRKEVELNFNNEVSVILSPNPSNAEVTVEVIGFEKNRAILVADINGKTIMVKNTVESIFKMDVSNLHQGLYFITVKDHLNSLSKKLIINH
ncbi:MAG: cellulase family glycosylhydrolase [Bacteroidetes bacterium]|nr:cellulase family glycosylhydrolase [Bacteroidota bacterium]